LAASKALVLEVERLCEVVADDFAVRNLGNKNAPALESARAIFKDSAF
jgi:Zn-dependent protease with chaperone function